MTYYFSGSVNESSIPVIRTIRAHRVDTGAVVGEIASNEDGSFTLETTYSGAHYIICMDNYDVGIAYNDLVYGNVYPTISG